ncbi:hypothetical protein [Hymenobacter cellulosivorans]|uniref:DUF695 domain-containing protein n=1 Tax=Hymenobacter cellulosivorans TaxID=2932249 RepID=A0ABY4FG16_9BACT|nr:hypothetical protein [Hymenobacter cellulosivorans]UOQ54948.1 hypothetical protein MUN80_09365 [Hymenobacter cellulosivorans]
MTQECKIEIAFGIPEHGWLPITFHWQDFHLAIDASDVPVDPVQQLVTMLIQLNKGIQRPDEILWNLEPECYYLQIENISHQYHVQLFHATDFSSSRTLIKEFTGNYSQIILPFYRELKKFNSYAYKAPHWDKIDPGRIDLLTTLVSKNK